MSDNAVVRLTPTGVLAYDNCPAGYRFSRVDGWEADVKSANLVFGSAIHDVCLGHVRDVALGKPARNLASEFEAKWAEVVATEVIGFSSRLGCDEILETGKKLCELFPEAWDRLRLTPLVDDRGLVVERRFDVELPGGVILSGEPDVVAMDPWGAVVILDLKTASSPSEEGFELRAEQLTAYQVVVEAHRRELGFDRLDRLGFLEAIKRKVGGKGPEVAPTAFAPRRTDEEVREYLQKVLWMAEDMRRGRYPKRPRMAWNSPCEMCDVPGLCLRGDTTGYHRRGETPPAPAIAANS